MILYIISEYLSTFITFQALITLFRVLNIPISLMFCKIYVVIFGIPYKLK